jgi:hypothetical protein
MTRSSKRPRSSKPAWVFSYLTKMTRAHTLIVLVGLTAMFAVPARAQSDIMSDNYNIMVPEKGYKPSQPEPWLAPKYKSPRGTVKRVTIPKTTTVSPAEHTGPPDLYVPQTGRTVPNLPTVSGSGRGGVETFQDRAMRCSHQAGVFGQTAGDRGSYMGACLNQ